MGYFYQMYTCIAYFIEIRKFCSKNLVQKGVNFEAQNALKLTYILAPLISKNFWGLYPRTPVKGGRRGKRGRGGEGGETPQFTFLAMPLGGGAYWLAAGTPGR